MNSHSGISLTFNQQKTVLLKCTISQPFSYYIKRVVTFIQHIGINKGTGALCKASLVLQPAQPLRATPRGVFLAPGGEATRLHDVIGSELLPTVGEANPL